mgnify:CR=1
MDLEVGHQELSRLTVVGDLHTRKRLMLDGSDAVFCLPGGCGTFEELFEAMTFKRLGLFLGPIVLINTMGPRNRPRRLKVMASKSSSNVPHPPGRQKTASDPSSIRRLRVCKSPTTVKRLSS